MDISPDVMPAMVRAAHDFLREHTDTEPRVRHQGYGCIQLTHTSDRIQMTMTFRLKGRKWIGVGSTLVIDGKKEPIAASWGQYAAIFQDPDHGRHNYTPPDARKADLPATHPVAEQDVPTTVVSAANQLRKAITTEGTYVTIEATDDERYLVCARREDEARQFVFIFGCVDEDWQLQGRVAVNNLGYDVTHLYADGLEKEILDFLGAQSRGNQRTFHPGGSTQQAASTNSVNVRKSTVFRV